MKNRTIIVSLMFLCFHFCFKESFAAETVPWNDPQRRAYYPNPILFVHGINSKASTWEKIFYNNISGTNVKMTNYFEDYYNWTYSPSQPDNPNSLYMHTFDYGGEHGDQTFDGVAVNAWDADRDQGDTRLTLERAVDQVYQVYNFLNSFTRLRQIRLKGARERL